MERHIEILLLNNDCVIVPALGGFMAHHVEARIDEADSQYLPPTRTLGFNPKLQLNDNLLVQSYVEAYDISYPEALQRIEAEVAEVKDILEQTGFYELNDIGTLSKVGEGKYEFQPCPAGILTPSLYGLSNFELTPLASTRSRNHEADSLQEPSAEAQQQEDIPSEKTISVRISVIRNAIAIAAAAVLFFLISTPLGQEATSLGMGSGKMETAHLFYKMMSDQTAPAVQTPQPSPAPVSPTPQPEAKSVAPALPPTNTPQPDAKPALQTSVWHVVLACGISREYADEYVSKLSDRGMTQGGILEQKGKSRKIIYGQYQTRDEAVGVLRTFHQQKEFRDAWLFEEKL